MLKNWRLIAVPAVIALAVGLVGGRFLGRSGSAAAPAVADARLAPPAQKHAAPAGAPVYRVPIDDSATKGPADALVTIVEASDFQCPFCKQAQGTLAQLAAAYPGKVRFAFKHNPLSMHPLALPAARAAEQARAQGGDAAFWAMHDKLFQLSPALDPQSLEGAAGELGLDVTAFRAGLNGGGHDARIQRDQKLLSALGANSTPSFFVNGRLVVGAPALEAFKGIVDEELKKADALVQSGTAAKDVYARTTEQGLTSAPAPSPSAAAPAPQPAAKTVPIRADDPVRGPAVAKVTLVLFSDFQCPFCGRLEPTLNQVEKTYGKDVRIVWKHQPLSMHPNAMPAAEAAEAARAQGKFWGMHDLMFANQQALSPTSYQQWAKQLGLDLGKFQASVDSHQFRARIDQDIQLANSVGATGTPTLFINCMPVVGAKPFEQIQPVIDSERRKADDALKAGAKLDDKLYDRLCADNVKTAVANAPAALPPAVLTLRPDDPVRGNPKASVTIVEFSDFECPFCGRVEPALAQVLHEYGSKVRLVWKHQPLSMHPNALPAAFAAEAAREQGKFWEMHDLIFKNQTALSNEAYERWATELGLDLKKFRDSIQSRRNFVRIQQDSAEGSKAGAGGTPTFFVNGEILVGAQPFETFKATIDRQLLALAKAH